MRELSFLFLFLTILFPLIGAYRNQEKIYQLPFLYSVAFLIYVMPTLLAIMETKASLDDTSYIRFTLFAAACVWSACLGYYLAGRKQIKPIRRNFQYVYDDDKLCRAIYVFMAISFVLIVILGGFDPESRTGGTYAILLYPARFLRPATIMLLTVYLVKPSRTKLAFLIVSFLLSLKIILIDGRRSEAFNLFITIGFPLFFIKGYKIPRIFVIPGILGSIFIFTFFPVMRQYTMRGNFDKVLTLSPLEAIQNTEEADGRPSEIVDGARNMDVATLSGDYNYGVSAINLFVNQFASSTFFGKDFKESMTIDPELDLSYQRDKYSKSDNDLFRFYLAPTGTAAIYLEFGYFGVIVFFLFGYMTRRFYMRAEARNDIPNIMFYCFFSTFILFSVYDTIMSIPTMISGYLIVFYVSTLYARKKRFFTQTS